MSGMSRRRLMHVVRSAGDPRAAGRAKTHAHAAAGTSEELEEWVQNPSQPQQRLHTLRSWFKSSDRKMKPGRVLGATERDERPQGWDGERLKPGHVSSPDAAIPDMPAENALRRLW